MPEFELLDTAGDISGKLRLIYGYGPTDPAPFVLMLTDHDNPIFPDLARDRIVDGPNQLWVADITYIAIRVGRLRGVTRRHYR